MVGAIVLCMFLLLHDRRTLRSSSLIKKRPAEEHLMYEYETAQGTLRIYKAKGRWCLYVLDDVYGQYDSPVAAADDVALHVTGNVRSQRGSVGVGRLG